MALAGILAGMAELLPVFPLGTVLFPGLPLPLHIFEERYRQLVRELLARPEPRQFGVIAIRQGREVGPGAATALYDVGCLATVREAAELEDGRFRLMTVGGQRFRLGKLDRSRPYLQAELTLLPEEAGDAAAAELAARAVQDAFTAYLDALAERNRQRAASLPLPGDPVTLSYLVAAAMVLEIGERQALLAEPDAAARLRAERALLGREIAMLRSLPSAPAAGLRYRPYSPN